MVNSWTGEIDQRAAERRVRDVAAMAFVAGALTTGIIALVLVLISEVTL